MHAAYSGEYPRDLRDLSARHPGHLPLGRPALPAHRDPSFDLERALASHQLSVLIRLQALLFHLLVGLAVLVVAAQTTSFRAAYVAMVAYLFNPGVVFDVAQWGQPDPVFGLFVLLAIAAACGSEARGSGSPGRDAIRPTRGSRLLSPTAGLSSARPPPAWPSSSPRWPSRRPGSTCRWWRCSSGAAAACWASSRPGWPGPGAPGSVALPFLLHGTLRELIGLPGAISSAMPVVTANAHNLWWAFSSGGARWYLDQEAFVGPLSYRLVGMGIVGACAGLALLRVVREPTRGVVFDAAAYTAFAFFMGMTQIHENHMYAVFPLLAVAAALSWRLWPLYAVLALTWCANMLLHDFDLAEAVVAPALPWLLEDAQRANALVNVAVFTRWTVWMVAATARAWLVPVAARPAAHAATEA